MSGARIVNTSTNTELVNVLITRLTDQYRQTIGTALTGNARKAGEVGMIDKEKVIGGLELLAHLPDGLIITDKEKWIKPCCEMAIALLKEQEHSETFIVIDNKTGEEADMYNIALHEEWAQHLCYCDMEGWAIEDDGTLLLVDECGRFAYADRERFKVKWE